MRSWPANADITAITIGEMPMMREPLPTLVRPHARDETQLIEKGADGAEERELDPVGRA